MHMERAGARRRLHVRALNHAASVRRNWPSRSRRAKAAQWTAQFVGPPALAQPGEQHRQGEFVVAGAGSPPAGDGGARPAAWRARTARNARGRRGHRNTRRGQDRAARWPRRPGIRAGPAGGPADRVPQRQGHQHGQLAQRHRRTGQAGLVLGEQPAQALPRGKDGIGRERRVGDLDQQGDARSGEIDAEAVRPVVQPGARRRHADPLQHQLLAQALVACQHLHPLRLLQHGLGRQSDQLGVRRTASGSPLRPTTPTTRPSARKGRSMPGRVSCRRCATASSRLHRPPLRQHQQRTLVPGTDARRDRRWR